MGQIIDSDGHTLEVMKFVGEVGGSEDEAV